MEPREAETVHIGYTNDSSWTRSCDASRHPLGPTVDSRPACDPRGVCAVDVHHPDVAILCRVGHVVIRVAHARDPCPIGRPRRAHVEHTLG